MISKANYFGTMETHGRQDIILNMMIPQNLVLEKRENIGGEKKVSIFSLKQFSGRCTILFFNCIIKKHS
jgi:hypothetical protein